MNILKRDPRMVIISTWIYRLLLITYPKNFRHEYAECMAQVFRDCSLRAYHTRGLPGMFSLWKMTLVDYIKSVFEAYTRAIMHLNPSNFIHLSGWALILGTATFLSGLIIDVQISGHGNPYDLYNYYSRPIDQALATLRQMLIPGAILFLTIGIIGLYLRCVPRAGLWGKIGLVAGIAGGILTFAASCMEDGWGWGGLTLFLVGNQVGGWWLSDLVTVAFFLMFAGLFLFGIDAVKRRLLRRWNFLPIIVGTLIPLRIMVGYLQEATTHDGWERWPVNLQMINPPMLIVTFIGLVALGYLLLSDESLKVELVKIQPTT